MTNSSFYNEFRNDTEEYEYEIKDLKSKIKYLKEELSILQEKRKDVGDLATLLIIMSIMFSLILTPAFMILLIPASMAFYYGLFSLLPKIDGKIKRMERLQEEQNYYKAKQTEKARQKKNKQYEKMQEEAEELLKEIYERARKQNEQRYRAKTKQKEQTENIFANCKTKAQVKKVYRQKAKEVHPDLGGNKEEFLKLNLDYERALKYAY